MIEKRAAKRCLEEVIQDRVMRMAVAVQIRVDRQRPRIVETHREADGVAAGHVVVLLSAVELVLFLIKAVYEVARATPRQVVRAGRQRVRPLTRLRAGSSGCWNESINLEWRVGEMASECGRRGGVHAVGCQWRRG